MSPLSFYETERAVSEYLLFHYGASTEMMPWSFGPIAALEYPARCVSECLDIERLPLNPRALDLGCAVGRSTFELARHCQEVVGIDFSERFIEVAGRLKDQGSLAYEYAEEGLLRSTALATVPPEIDRMRVRFEHGDAQALRPDLGQFDVVLLANLLDRLPDPRAFLQVLPSLIRRGGQLICATPCTWLEEYTPVSNWLGGFVHQGHSVTTLATLEFTLGPSFSRVRTLDLPFSIREHRRKFQWSVAQSTVWIRKDSEASPVGC